MITVTENNEGNIDDIYKEIYSKLNKEGIVDFIKNEIKFSELIKESNKNVLFVKNISSKLNEYFDKEKELNFQKIQYSLFSGLSQVNKYNLIKGFYVKLYYSVSKQKWVTKSKPDDTVFISEIQVKDFYAKVPHTSLEKEYFKLSSGINKDTKIFDDCLLKKVKRDFNARRKEANSIERHFNGPGEILKGNKVFSQLTNQEFNNYTLVDLIGSSTFPESLKENDRFLSIIKENIKKEPYSCIKYSSLKKYLYLFSLKEKEELFINLTQDVGVGTERTKRIEEVIYTFPELITEEVFLSLMNKVDKYFLKCDDIYSKSFEKEKTYFSFNDRIANFNKEYFKKYIEKFDDIYTYSWFEGMNVVLKNNDILTIYSKFSREENIDINPKNIYLEDSENIKEKLYFINNNIDSLGEDLFYGIDLSTDNKEKIEEKISLIKDMSLLDKDVISYFNERC